VSLTGKRPPSSTLWQRSDGDLNRMPTGDEFYLTIGGRVIGKGATMPGETGRPLPPQAWIG